MNKNILIVLAGGFVIAILVAILVQAGLSGDKKPAAPLNKIEILIAAETLRTGSELTARNVKWQEWPETMLFEGAIRRQGSQTPLEAASGRMKSRVAAGQPIHKTMLVDASHSTMFSASVRTGYRAIGIRVPVESIAGGLIGPGDHVDVLMTYSLTRTGDSTIARKYGTETLLENIRVLGIDTKSVAQDTEEEASKRSKTRVTVTLEVKPADAEKLALANEMGDVYFAMRSLGDDAPVAGDKATTDIGASRVLREMVGGGQGGVRIYNGATISHQLSGGVGNDLIGRDEADLDVGEPTEELIPPDDALADAVREGIADGIARGMSGRE